MRNNLCSWFGHRWIYKDLSKTKDETGKAYKYSAVRKCKRCERYEYKFHEWVGEDMVHSHV